MVLFFLWQEPLCKFLKYEVEIVVPENLWVYTVIIILKKE